MSRAAPTLFEDLRLTLDEAIELTADALTTHAVQHPHWGLAWSGGKDSTALLTLLIHLLESGRVPPPQSLRIFYADTRLELLPLWLSAQAIRDRLAQLGHLVEVVMAPLDQRFMVYLLGRGVPPPNNRTLRWCTGQIKVEPMEAALGRALAGIEGGILMLTGVRMGESAVRDARIVLSCSRDGAECGQGWYQQALPNARGLRGRISTLAPILHFRVCHVWDWLRFHAPSADCGGFPTALLAEAYGGEEADESEARTGCVGCPLAEKDLALDGILRMERWAYLAPLKEIRPLWRDLRKPWNRLRKPGGECRADGTLVRNQQRMGPITLEARSAALDRVLGIQTRINTDAVRLGRPCIDLLNGEEEMRIRELIALGTWPNKWDGSEPTADTPLDAIYSDGTVQPLLGTW